MSMDVRRTDAMTRHGRQPERRGPADKQAARDFDRRLRRDEEERASTAWPLSPFELFPVMRLRLREEESASAGGLALVPVQGAPLLGTDACSTALPIVDPDRVQAQMQQGLQMEAVARAAIDTGLKAAMAQASGEYQMELGSGLFARTRLRVRIVDHERLDVHCDSDSASEREWFDRNRGALAARMAELTGREVQLAVGEAPT